jgi:hypothetical protein
MHKPTAFLEVFAHRTNWQGKFWWKIRLTSWSGISIADP